MSATLVAGPLHATRVRYLWWAIGAACIALGFVGYVMFLFLNWPFTKQSVIDVLQQATLRSVKIDGFHKTFLPPGCVAERVQFEHHVHKNAPPIIFIDKLLIRGSWWGLLTAQYRLSLVKVQNMHVLVPPAEVHGKPDPLMPLNYTTNSAKTLRIDKIIADGAIVDFAHEDGSNPFRITIDQLAVYDISNNSAIHYKAVLTNSLPPGTIHSAGVFGPWRPKQPETTSVKGNYTYQNGNLSAFRDLRGALYANGKFDGTLGNVQTTGTAEVKNFQVTDTSHARDLKTIFRARVDGTNGNITLDEVRAQFDRSFLNVKGTIAGYEKGKGKTVALDIVCPTGRIEDVLDLFIEARRPPMVGALNMRAHVDVPPGNAQFLRRMRMSGDFGVGSGQFTDKETQADMNRLSESAEKKKTKDEPPASDMALSDLKGHGEIRSGMATLSNVTFTIPGASAKMYGTYSIINYDVNLHGKLFTDGEPWTATTGFKSFLTRIITPFLKKKKGERIVPFKITGNYNNVNVGLDLGPKK